MSVSGRRRKPGENEKKRRSLVNEEPDRRNRTSQRGESFYFLISKNKFLARPTETERRAQHGNFYFLFFMPSRCCRVIFFSLGRFVHCMCVPDHNCRNEAGSPQKTAPQLIIVKVKRLLFILIFSFFSISICLERLVSQSEFPEMQTIHFSLPIVDPVETIVLDPAQINQRARVAARASRAVASN